MVNCFEGFTYLFLEGEGRGERGRETLMCERNIDWSPLMCTLTGDRANNPDMYPEWELNWQPLTLWEDIQPTEPHQSGH